MAERAYVFTLWFSVAGGLFLAAMMASLSYGMPGFGLGATLLIGLATPIGGIFVGQATRNWMITLLGYLMVVLPIGYMIGPLVAMYQAASVVNAVYVTGLVTVGMWMLGTAIPPITRNFTGYIVGGILLLIVGSFAQAIFPAFGALRLVDWLGAAIFTALIVYDSNRAMQMDFTVDNAIKASIGLYLDIINLFLFLLDLFGRRRD